ncbi:MAG TPA: hypothetical protein VE954_03420 [Oligoflexus sp.]|uniref:hypothetical protein n=1 Tax=Oligoflexus sp. TaxID=1971216 RepID=UPI002D31B9B0|nr:hypothetical protein [Oligoflexus sp.]HYX32137.1 hypothetical protein [Oligoflexus sp.]
MKKFLKTLVIPGLLLSMSSSSQALDLGYSYEQLETVWQSIGAPDTRTFSEILGLYELSRTVLVDPAKGSVTGTQCRPPRVCVNGQKAPTGTSSGTTPPPSNEIIEFDVVRVSNPALLQDIYRRYAMLSLYISKNLAFNGVLLSPDDKARLDRTAQLSYTKQRSDLIRQEMASANLESYLLHLSQYYLAEDLPAKCVAMKSADAIYNQSIVKINPTVDLLPAWLPLYQQFVNYIKTIQGNANRFMACTVIPSTSRAEMVQTIKTTVAEEVNIALSDKVNATLRLLDAAEVVSGGCPAPGTSGFKNLSEFQKIACLNSQLNDVDFDLKATFEMARQVKNIKANLDFIKEAEGGVRSRQDSMREEAGLDNLYVPKPNVQAFPKLSEAVAMTKEVAELQVENTLLKGQIKSSLDSLVSVSTALGAAKVSECSDAVTSLAALTPQGTTTLDNFTKLVESCLSKLSANLAANIVATNDDRLQEKFTADVNSLSSAVLSLFETNPIKVIDELPQ